MSSDARLPTIILADDHPMVLQGLERLLEARLEVMAKVDDGEALLETATRLQPDLIITDISMPGINGIEAIRGLQKASPSSRTLILSLHEDPEWVRAAFDAGAWAYLTKTSAAEEIENAVQEVLANRFYVSPKVARGLLSLPAPTAAPQTSADPVEKALPAAARLTHREREVVGLIGEGLANKDIAMRLGIALTTVRTHLSSIYNKLGYESRVELALSSASILDRER